MPHIEEVPTWLVDALEWADRKLRSAVYWNNEADVAKLMAIRQHAARLRANESNCAVGVARGDEARPADTTRPDNQAPRPSPPQDDIVAGLRDCLIRSKPEGDEAIVPIKLWERAIAALGEKGEHGSSSSSW